LDSSARTEAMVELKARLMAEDDRTPLQIPDAGFATA
jgi:hypothetical protein